MALLLTEAAKLSNDVPLLTAPQREDAGLQDLQGRLAALRGLVEPLRPALHRSCYDADERVVAVAHILDDGRLEDHAAAMDRLLDKFKLPHNGDLFRSRDEAIADALTRQAKRVAYVGGRPPVDGDEWEHAP